MALRISRAKELWHACAGDAPSRMLWMATHKQRGGNATNRRRIAGVYRGHVPRNQCRANRIRHIYARAVCYACRVLRRPMRAMPPRTSRLSVAGSGTMATRNPRSQPTPHLPRPSHSLTIDSRLQQLSNTGRLLRRESGGCLAASGRRKVISGQPPLPWLRGQALGHQSMPV